MEKSTLSISLLIEEAKLFCQTESSKQYRRLKYGRVVDLVEHIDGIAKIIDSNQNK